MEKYTDHKERYAEYMELTKGRQYIQLTRENVSTQGEVIYSSQGEITYKEYGAHTKKREIIIHKEKFNIIHRVYTAHTKKTELMHTRECKHTGRSYLI